MSLESITQDQIDGFNNVPKRVKNPGVQEKDKLSHKEKRYKLDAQDESGMCFEVFTRQNNRIPDDFSCGIMLLLPSGLILTLARYNGSSHDHKNLLENEKLTFSCHIHRAREEYIKAGKKAEGFAEETNRYSTMKGALHCLLLDFNISGLSSDEDSKDLFDALKS